ncbi:MAG: hypothetical protein LC808_39975, partial [Actinobacteria bacterium]|nr:hypothetical protein [Actinomycetota bacterium]
LRTGHEIVGFEPEKRPEIPLAALREAVVNALVHRDYTIPGPSKSWCGQGGPDEEPGVEDIEQVRWPPRGHAGEGKSAVIVSVAAARGVGKLAIRHSIVYQPMPIFAR